MSAAPALVLEHQTGPRRSSPRHPINVPVDAIILRSGIPDSLPGRCTDLSETGVGAVFAGELIAGQTVAIELRLPNVAVPVRARALVRYHHLLRCGLQFVGLTADQKQMIRYWSYQVAAQPVVSDGAKEQTPTAENSPSAAAEPDRERPQRRIRIRRRKLYFVLAVILSLAALGWWQWQRAWRELEAPGAAPGEPQSGAPVRLSPEIMEARTVYKVNPVYPETARLAGTQGLVVLDALIGTDGTVKHLRPVAGPDALAQSAQDAVQSWRFEPYSPDGEAVEVETTIAIEFRLN